VNAGENPRAALAALLPTPVAVPGTAEEVRPFSLAMFAALDAIRSPLLYGAAEDATPLAVIPSLFVACKGWREAQKPDLFDRAMAWADALPPSALPALKDAVAAQVRVLLDVTPESKKKDGTEPTAGS
jgi:hypothetical protein